MNLPKGSDAKKSMDIIRQKNLTKKYERHNPNVKSSNPMTNLLSFDEVDAFITEHDGGCVHDWKKKLTPQDSWQKAFVWQCKCDAFHPPCEYNDGDGPIDIHSKPPTIDNPIARDLGKLRDLAVGKKLKVGVYIGPLYNKGPWIARVVIGNAWVTITVNLKDYDTPKLAACAALGNGIVQVLKEQKGGNDT